MRGTVIICGLILAAAIAVTVYSGMRSREQKAHFGPASANAATPHKN